MIVITVARKPTLTTVAVTVLTHATGALNIDAARIEVDGGSPSIQRRQSGTPAAYITPLWGNITSRRTYCESRPGEEFGRWPANLILSANQVEAFDEQSGDRPSTLTGRADPTRAFEHPSDVRGGRGMFSHLGGGGHVYADGGGASRFFKVVSE